MKPRNKEALKQKYREDVLELSSIFPNYSLEELFNIYKSAGHSVERALESLVQVEDESNADNEEQNYYSDDEAVEVDYQEEENNIDSTSHDNEIQVPWKVLTREQLLYEQQSDVDKVQQVLQLSDIADTHTVLKHYRWNTEKLISDYVTLGREFLLKNAGILSDSIVSDDSKTCSACYEEDCNDMVVHTCGHSFCTTCWKDYITSIVKDGYAAQNNIHVS
jgi:hypothetical protein